MRRRQVRLIFLILFGSLVTYLVGNDRVGLWDRDEPRYAQTSRQMLQSGDWVVPRLYDAVRTAKPIFIYWCQAASMKLFGDTAGAARLPSAIAMTLTLAILAVAIGRGAGPWRAVWTVFILGTSLLPIWAAKSCLTDAVLLLFVTAAQLCLYAMWRGNRSWPVVILFSIAVGLAGLTKGPVVLGILATTVLMFGLLKLIDLRSPPSRKGRARELPERGDAWFAGSAIGYEAAFPREPRTPVAIASKALAGIAIIAIVVGPWLYLIEHRVPGYILGSLNKEVVDRARTPQEGHAGPPGYYLITIWAMFFPWSLLLPAAVAAGWGRRRLPQVRFALAAVVGPWIMLELARTKLPHYLLPAYPFLAFLVADLLVRAGRGTVKAFGGKAFIRIVFAWGVIVAAGGALPWLALHWFSLNRTAMFGLIIFSIATAEYARNVYVSFHARKPLIAAGVMGVGMLALVAILHVGFLPAADFLRISPRVAEVLKTERAAEFGDAIMIDYKEPSLAFYQGGTIREEWRNDFLTTVHPLLWPMWIVVTQDVWAKTPPQIQARLEVVDSVRGWDPAGRGIVNVLILRRL